MKRAPAIATTKSIYVTKPIGRRWGSGVAMSSRIVLNEATDGAVMGGEPAFMLIEAAGKVAV
jgi:hypothetical protein